MPGMFIKDRREVRKCGAVLWLMPWAENDWRELRPPAAKTASGVVYLAFVRVTAKTVNTV